MTDDEHSQATGRRYRSPPPASPTHHHRTLPRSGTPGQREYQRRRQARFIPTDWAMDDPFESTPVAGAGQGSTSSQVSSQPLPPTTAIQLERTPSPDILSPDLSAASLRTHLQALLEHKSGQLQMVGTMGQKILAQQAELEERIQSLGDVETDGEEIDQASQAKLLELQEAMRGWDSDNQGIMRELQAPKVSMLHGVRSPQSESSEMLTASQFPASSGTLSTPGKINGETEAPATLRRQRNTAQHRALDMEFATEIGQNLLVEVRRLQALVNERDRALVQLGEEKEGWEAERQNLVTAVKTAETTAGEYM